MANWAALEEAAKTAESKGDYRSAIGHYNALLASARRVGHTQMIEYCKSKIDQMGDLLDSLIPGSGASKGD